MLKLTPTTMGNGTLHWNIWINWNGWKQKLILMDQGYPSYQMFQELIQCTLAFVVRLNRTFSSIMQRNEKDFIMDDSPVVTKNL